MVGSAADAQGQPRAFLWTPLAGMLDLGPGEAVALNEFDHVVGLHSDGGTLAAFVWTAADGRIELGGDARAIDVNNNGYIVGDVFVSTNSQVVIWRSGLTDADWLVYRYGLVDAHVAYGTLGRGHAHALRAQLKHAQRAAEAGRHDQAQQALARFARRLGAWSAAELPWQ